MFNSSRRRVRTLLRYSPPGRHIVLARVLLLIITIGEGGNEIAFLVHGIRAAFLGSGVSIHDTLGNKSKLGQDRAVPPRESVNSLSIRIMKDLKTY